MLSDIVTQAKQLIDKADTWADASNALFDPETGLLTTTYRSRQDRTAFVASPEYAEIAEYLGRKMDA